jgi:hypothetical protein
VASGAVTFGSSLIPADTSTACPNADPKCTYVQEALPPGDSKLEAPASGVVVLWRMRAPTTGGDVRLRIVRVVKGDLVTTYTGRASAAAVVPSTNVDKVLSFPVQLPVKAGDRIGLDKPASMTGLFKGTGDGQNFFRRSSVFRPPLADNESRVQSSQRAGQLIVNADIEPDAEGDGFGDETQDSCAPGRECGDKTAPVLSRLRLSPRTFRVKRVRAAAKKRRRRAPAGALFAYSSSEVARVTFSLTRIAAGRRVRGKCRKRTRRNRGRRRCQLRRRAGSFTESAVEGQNVSDFSGLVGRRYLRPASYRVALSAVDGARNVSKPLSLRFRVVRR